MNKRQHKKKLKKQLMEEKEEQNLWLNSWLPSEDSWRDEPYSQEELKYLKFGNSYET